MWSLVVGVSQSSWVVFGSQLVLGAAGAAAAAVAVSKSKQIDHYK